MCGDGVLYVVNGGIKLRQGGASVNDCTQAYWDQTPSFMYIEASVEYLEGTAISDDGQIIDTWKILRKKP